MEILSPKAAPSETRVIIKSSYLFQNANVDVHAGYRVVVEVEERFLGGVEQFRGGASASGRGGSRGAWGVGAGESGRVLPESDPDQGPRRRVDPEPRRLDPRAAAPVLPVSAARLLRLQPAEDGEALDVLQVRIVH